jgi:hypothetical protein
LIFYAKFNFWFINPEAVNPGSRKLAENCCGSTAAFQEKPRQLIPKSSGLGPAFIKAEAEFIIFKGRISLQSLFRRQF